MNNPSILPSLDILARSAKESTIPVSLRVKEKTHAVFSYYAKQHNTTVGSLINELLNDYVSRIEGIDYNDIILDEYIDKKAVKLSRSNDDELLTRIIQSGLLDNYKENPGAFFRDIREMAKPETNNNYENSSDDGLYPRVVLGDSLNTMIVANFDKEASLDYDDESYILAIPAKKWVLATAILVSYTKKYISLYGRAKDKPLILIDPRTLEGIIAAINKKKTNEEMASQIAKCLEDFKGAED